MLLGLFIAIIISILIKSQKKLLTLGYGHLAGIATLVVMGVLTGLFQLNTAIMGHATAPLVLVIPVFAMWSHAKATARPPTATPPEDRRISESVIEGGFLSTAYYLWSAWAICIAAVNKSGARLRTTAYGVLAIAVTMGVTSVASSECFQETT